MGPVADLPPRRAEHDPEHTNFIVAGPWFHGQWHSAEGRQHRPDSVRRARDGARVPREDRGAVLPLLPARQGREAAVAGDDVPDRIESAGDVRRVAAEGGDARRSSICTPTARCRSSRRRARRPPYREYVSDPANPVPYRAASDFADVSGRRLAHVGGRGPAIRRRSPGRADVRERAARSRSDRHRRAVAPTLFASTSGTDSDFVVKLIDVYPENAQKNAWDADAGPQPGQYAQSLNGYELPIAMEVRRGRYNTELRDAAAARRRTRPTEWEIPLRDHDHVFLKGHRIMVQVQSTWFPLIDRNPQKFVPSIYDAKAGDFVKATQRVYCTPRECRRTSCCRSRPDPPDLVATVLTSWEATSRASFPSATASAGPQTGRRSSRRPRRTTRRSPAGNR